MTKKLDSPFTWHLRPSPTGSGARLAKNEPRTGHLARTDGVDALWTPLLHYGRISIETKNEVAEEIPQPPVVVALSPFMTKKRNIKGVKSDESLLSLEAPKSAATWICMLQHLVPGHVVSFPLVMVN